MNSTHRWVYCQTLGLVLRLRVDFVLPLSQEEEQEPPHQNLSEGGVPWELLKTKRLFLSIKSLL